ncbi:MAG: hypothetical protein GY737_05920 [Desulfobacteraceae bacterium]|nr:hypothetical protein [Desulfobacteraceae bacterium]
MYIIATALLIIGTLAGAAFGVMFEQTHLETLFSSAAGGFAGSLIGGALFTYLYLTADEEEDEDEDETPHPETFTALPPREQSGLTRKSTPESDKKLTKRLENKFQAIINNRRE